MELQGKRSVVEMAGLCQGLDNSTGGHAHLFRREGLRPAVMGLSGTDTRGEECLHGQEPGAAILPLEVNPVALCDSL